MAEASTARKLILEELERLKQRAVSAKAEGRTASDIPLTLHQGIILWEALLVLTTYYDHHLHDVEVNKQPRETSPPR